MDEWLKKVLQEEAEQEAEEIMAEVEQDERVCHAKAPEEVHDRLFAQIRAYEAEKAYKNLSDEDKELIALGKVYKRRRKWNKLAVLAAIFVLVLAMEMVSLGQGESFFELISTTFAGRDRSVVNSGSTEPVIYVDEEEIYTEIEETYGIVPVKLVYLPGETAFMEAITYDTIQEVNMLYGSDKDAEITYIIRPNYRESSLAVDIEDVEVQRYEMVLEETKVTVKQYQISGTEDYRWIIHFKFKEVQYFMMIEHWEQNEVERIIETLDFPQGRV